MQTVVFASQHQLRSFAVLCAAELSITVWNYSKVQPVGIKDASYTVTSRELVRQVPREQQSTTFAFPYFRENPKTPEMSTKQKPCC